VQVTRENNDLTSHLLLNRTRETRVAANECVAERSSQTVYLIDDDLRGCQAMIEPLASLNLKVIRFGSAEDYLKHGKQDEPGCLIVDNKYCGRYVLQSSL
jgi:response regulator RpfG family c-di-GMP phosphodiesterase